MTSIGYGDIVATPLHGTEQVVCVCMMLTGSLLFAYLVGSFCGLAANLSPDVMRFRQDLTDLNKFLSTANIPNTLRYELREYMHHGQALRRAQTANRLLGDFAPKLRNEVALQINEKWLRRVTLINEECEDGVVLELAFALKLNIFPPGDSCPVGFIYIVSRGAALFAGRAYVSGGSWGEADALLETKRLQFPIPASAVSYLFAYSIDGITLRNTMSQLKYPDAYARMRARQVTWIVRRGIVRMAEERVAIEAGTAANRIRTSRRGSLTLARSPLCKTGSMLAEVVSCAQQQRHAIRAMKTEGFEKTESAARRKGRISKERLNRAARVSNEVIPQANVSLTDGGAGLGELTREKLHRKDERRPSISFGPDVLKGLTLPGTPPSLNPTPMPRNMPRLCSMQSGSNGASAASSARSMGVPENIANQIHWVVGEVQTINKGMAEMKASMLELRKAQTSDTRALSTLLRQVSTRLVDHHLSV